MPLYTFIQQNLNLALTLLSPVVNLGKDMCPQNSIPKKDLSEFPTPFLSTGWLMNYDPMWTLALITRTLTITQLDYCNVIDVNLSLVMIQKLQLGPHSVM